MSKGRVLCIDDEPHILRALNWLLQRDFEVHTTDRPSEALRLLHRHDFDVVVSDQRMPDMTGAELLRHARHLAPRAMRILLTGYSDLDAMHKAVNEGEVYRFITKPWDMRSLPKVIEEAAAVARTEPVAIDAEAAVGGTVENAASVPVANDTVAPPSAREALLVIDDAPDVHAVADECLAGSVEVLHAHDLATALKLLDTRQVALIVSEIKVGGLDATRLLRLMKSSRPEILSLVVSAQRDAETVMALINQGQVFRIVPKPVKAGFLRLLVNAALIRHRQLLASPSVKRRFHVEKAGDAVAQTLLRDIMATGMAGGAQLAPAGAGRGPARFEAAIPGAANGSTGIVDTLRAGFRRLFGS